MSDRLTMRQIWAAVKGRQMATFEQNIQPLRERLKFSKELLASLKGGMRFVDEKGDRSHEWIIKTEHEIREVERVIGEIERRHEEQR